MVHPTDCKSYADESSTSTFCQVLEATNRPHHCNLTTGAMSVTINQRIKGVGKKVLNLKTLLIIIVGFLPSLFSLWLIRKTQLRVRSRFRQATFNFSRTPTAQNIRSMEGDRYYLEGVGYLIGDISCKFNAHSGYIRCAVNPCGPCEGCNYYEPKEFTDSQKFKN